MKTNGYLLKDVIPAIAVSTTSIDLVATYPKINGQTITLEVLTGSVYVKPGTGAVTTSTGNKLEGKVSIDINASSGVNVISDSSATMQIWIYG